jgi:hypothetical protein
MKLTTPRCHARQLRAATAWALLLALNTAAIAGPGAHGPNGEHLDAPGAALVASTLPRLEARSESFELVAELRAAELVIVVDRYETNEPVLGAKLEVESGGLKAVAAYRLEQGDYAVTDAALLKALAAPGEHGLVFTLVAGAESDLLDGTLVAGAGRAVASQGSHGHLGDDHGHDHELERAAWIGGGIAALGLLGGIAWWRQRRTIARPVEGTL